MCNKIDNGKLHTALTSIQIFRFHIGKPHLVFLVPAPRQRSDYYDVVTTFPAYICGVPAIAPRWGRISSCPLAITTSVPAPERFGGNIILSLVPGPAFSLNSVLLLLHVHPVQTPSGPRTPTQLCPVKGSGYLGPLWASQRGALS